MEENIKPEVGQAPEASEQTGQTETTATQSESVKSDSQTKAEEQFYADFNSLPDEVKTQLEPYYKQMQADYTRKTQKLSKSQREHLQKIQAYDQFMANPLDNIMRMATQYGLQFTPGGQQTQQQKQTQEDWTPNTWDDVFNKSQEYLAPKIQEMLTPYQQKIAELEAEIGKNRANTIEKQFNQIDPEWRKYEDEMYELLQEHPSLAKDPVRLYKLAVPEEVFKAKATQEAISILEKKTQAAKVESTGRSQQSTQPKNKIVSFDDAFRDAWNKHGRK